MSQEGRGRVQERSNKVFFSFETLNNSADSSFKLALDIPLYGSELMTVDYKDTSSPKFIVDGDDKKKKKQMKSLKRFVTTFTNFVVLREAISRNGQSQYCVDQGKYIDCAVSPGSQSFRIKKLEKIIRVISSTDSMRNIEIEFFDLKETYFSRITAKYRNQSLKKPYFQADLFLGDCFDGGVTK